MTPSPPDTASPVITVKPATSSSHKEAAKALARFVALVVMLPVLLIYWASVLLIGRDRALEDISQLLSLLPGLSGQYFRRAVLQHVLARCHHSVLVEFGTLFSRAGARLDENVYVGPRCILGLVHLERDVMLAANVHVPSGGKTHAFDDPSRPIREQGGERRLVTIGEGAWVGTSAVILADVGKGTIVAAGAVVTKPLPDNVVAAGIPARVLRSRFAEPSVDVPERSASF